MEQQQMKRTKKKKEEEKKDWYENNEWIMKVEEDEGKNVVYIQFTRNQKPRRTYM